MAKKEKTMATVKKIYVLHGWTYNIDKWQKFTDLMGKYGFGVQLLEIPGLTAKSNKVWTLDDYVTWLSKELNEKDIILVGHSNGGRIAAAYAAKYPKKIKHLILIDSAGIYHNELPIRLKRLLFKNIVAIGKKFTQSEKLRRFVYKLARERDYHDATVEMRKTMANLISLDITSLLVKIVSPTLVIWGDLDNVTPITDAYKIRNNIRNSKLVVISGAGHSPHYSHPEDTAKKIMAEIS